MGLTSSELVALQPLSEAADSSHKAKITDLTAGSPIPVC